MLRTLFTWSSIAFLLAMSPLIHIQIQAFLTHVGVFPAIKAIASDSQVSVGAIFIIFNLLSSAFTASITILPSSYLAPNRTVTLAVLFALALVSLPVSVFWQLPEASTLATVIMIGELVAIACSTVVFARIGTLVGARRR